MVLNKLSIKIFIKKKPEQKRPVLTECLSFKMSVNYMYKKTPDSVKHILSDTTPLFARHCLMSGANIQA